MLSEEDLLKMNDSYRCLIPLIEKKSVIADPEKFHNLVNVIFHDFESKHYDELHREMWESLPQQYELLINDIEPHVQNTANLKLLDVGCGTGLATELLLKTKLGNKISDVHLLDTSAKMLNEALKRSKGWNKQVKTINGLVADVSDQYDVIIISSVLHHIPDLADFLNDVSRVQKPGGILITIHDPNEGALSSDEYVGRATQYEQYMGDALRKTTLGKRVVSKLKRVLKIPTYLQQINQQLLRESIIKEPLTDGELWSITDIHVEGLPYSTGKGIAKDMMIKNLPGYTLLSYRTYTFFGYMYSNLDGAYKKQEIELAKKKDPYGRNFCSVWIKETIN